MTPLHSTFLPTRQSLISRLTDKDDQRRWHEFFCMYRNLIWNAAVRAGLREAEAEEVVQETLITVAKNIGKFRYDPTAGSFKGWLLCITRWRIADQFRKRRPEELDIQGFDGEDGTSAIERFPEPQPDEFKADWERDWREQMLQTALEKVKLRVEPRHFQIFDCYVLKEWPAQKVAEDLGVNVAQVYLIRHRISRMLKREVQRMERGG
ncbi:MAG TPA: sigma-70 family RNA polymerase sigma factor [Chthoniobacterales bacterium]